MEILNGTQLCPCGKYHHGLLQDCLVGASVVSQVAQLVRKYGGTRAFLLADANTFSAAGRQVTDALSRENIPYSQYIFPHSPKPEEKAVGSAVMHYDTKCDIIIGIGSGVINDIGKILAANTKHPYIIVATAPSMDGYASATSSMEMDGLKVSLPSKCADGVIGDTDILKNAPRRMLVSGLGDMLAKYVSICEWRIAHLITGEYYCEAVADLIRTAVQKCRENAAGLINREEKAVNAVFEGLILGGVAMNYAGVSRPASGVEHYFSHVWDMRGLEFGTPVDFHGIQCAVGTLYATRIYEKLLTISPDREKALHFVQNFDVQQHFNDLRAFLGKGAEAMIAAEEKDKKYDPVLHEKRLAHIFAHWEEIRQIISQELLPATELEQLLTMLDAPKTAAEMGIDEGIVPMSFRATKDIRDKYVLSRLCWDLGVLNEL